MKVSTALITTLALGAAGVVAATFLIPSKGERNRRALIKKGREYKDYLVDGVSDIAESISHTFESAENEAIRLGKEAANKTKGLAS